MIRAYVLAYNMNILIKNNKDRCTQYSLHGSIAHR